MIIIFENSNMFFSIRQDFKWWFLRVLFSQIIEIYFRKSIMLYVWLIQNMLTSFINRWLNTNAWLEAFSQRNYMYSFMILISKQILKRRCSTFLIVSFLSYSALIEVIVRLSDQARYIDISVFRRQRLKSKSFDERDCSDYKLQQNVVANNTVTIK